MRRFRSVLVAGVLLVLGSYARQMYSADYISSGFSKQWLDANGTSIGEAYNWGTRVGPVFSDN